MSPGTEAARLLLRAGWAAGPLYVGLGLAQMLLRDGFDPRRHALSVLANGPGGWVQVLNFVVVGALVLAGAAGIRRVLRGRRGGTWGPLLLGAYGAALIGAGIFRADPAPDFPPGTVVDPALGMSTSGMLHFVFGGIGFYALIGASLVFTRRFAELRRAGWAVFSAITGVFLFGAFAAVAFGATTPTALLALTAAVLLTWIWHALLMRGLMVEAGPVQGAGIRARSA